MTRVKHVVNGDPLNGWYCYECDFFTHDVAEAAFHDGTMANDSPRVKHCINCGEVITDPEQECKNFNGPMACKPRGI